MKRARPISLYTERITWQDPWHANTCRCAQRCRLLHAAYTHVCHERRAAEKRFLGKVPRRIRLGGSLYSHAPSNRKNVITERIKVRETTSVTRLRWFRRRRPRPDAEFKYRRKYSAFDSRNCCIRHLSPPCCHSKTRSLLSPFLHAKGRQKGSEEGNKGVIHCQHLSERLLKVHANVLKSSPFLILLLCYL